MQQANGVLAGLHEHQIHLAGAGYVEHAGAAGGGRSGFVNHWLGGELHGDQGGVGGLGLFDGRDGRIVAFLSIGQPNGRRDLGAGQMLECLEVLFGFRRVAGALQCARQLEFGRGVNRIDLQCFFERLDGLVELLHFSVTDPDVVPGVDVAGIKFDGVLKALQRCVEFVARMLREAEVVPHLGTVRIEGNRRLQGLLGLVEFLEGHEGDALVDGGLRHLRILFEGLGETVGRLLSELLAHLRDAAIVQAHGVGIEPRLSPGMPGPECEAKEGCNPLFFDIAESQDSLSSCRSKGEKRSKEEPIQCMRVDRCDFRDLWRVASHQKIFPRLTARPKRC